jgi:hypothetical protein
MAVPMLAAVVTAQTVGGTNASVPYPVPPSEPSAFLSIYAALLVGGGVILLGRLRKGRR